MKNNDFEKVMREFTHMFYGLMYALDSLDKSEKKIKQADLGKCLEKALEKKANHPYRSAIMDKESAAKDFSLDNETVHDVVVQTKRGINNLLVIGLCDLLDECLSKMLELDGDSGNTLCEKIKKMHIDRNKWFVKGVHELRIVRNCIVHNKGFFSKQTIEEIKEYVDNDFNALGNENVNLCFEDVFRFRRAIRTFINEVNERRKNDERQKNNCL